MKIRCRECGARFDYGSNSGICPKCMTYNPWTGDGQAPKNRPGRRFCIWAVGATAASVLLLSPFLYRTHREKRQEWDEYKAELEKDLEGDLNQEIPAGDTIHAGRYSLTPGTAFWLPEIQSVGLTENGSRLLVVPVTITVDDTDSRDREVEFGLESQDDSMGYILDFYMGDTCWPGLDGYTMHYGFMWEPDHEQNYLIFEAEAAADAVTLRVEESLIQPRTYETTVTRIYRTPLAMTGEEETMDPFFLESSHFPVIQKRAGEIFDYSDSRLAVIEVGCLGEAGDFPVPEGKKLMTVVLKRDAETWPYPDEIRAFTAVTDQEGRVSSNLYSYALGRWLDTNLSDLWGYYYDYNYRSSSDTSKEEEQENPETVYQCYLVDEDVTEVEIIFPGVSREEGEGTATGYWQIRVPVQLPPVGETVSYESGTVSTERRLVR